MKDLYRVTRTEKPLDINELLSQCMRLERSFREKFLNAISRTAVTLVNENIFYESGGHVNRYELKNAYKTMYVAIDCIDLMLNAYKPDYDEVLQELQDTKLMAKNGNSVRIYYNGFEIKLQIPRVFTRFLRLQRTRINFLIT